MPEHDVVLAGGEIVESGLDRLSLRLGALGQRRDPADRRRTVRVRSASCSSVGGRPRRMSV